MRKLVLLLGASSSGKSTWIKQNKLQNYVLSADQIRKSFGYESLTMIDNRITPYIHIEHERSIWDMFFELLKSRMEKGVTTIIDNTNTNFKTLNKYHHLAKLYNYEVTTVDFVGPYLPQVTPSVFCQKYPNFDFEPQIRPETIHKFTNTLLKRNTNRIYPVPEHVIKKQMAQYADLWDRFKKSPTEWTWLNLTTGATITGQSQRYQSCKLRQALICDEPINLDQYQKIQVIGDIHSDYSALMHAFDDHEPGTAYIFLGDYLDKGTRPYSTFDFLAHDLIGSQNLFFIRGNHETMWQDYLLNDKVDNQFAKTFWVLKRQYGEKKLKKMLSTMLSFCHDYFIFTYHGKTFYASHAGFEPQMAKPNFPINLMPEDSLVYGLGDNFNYHDPYSRDVDLAWKKHCIEFNLHGHRNNANAFVEDSSINLNLEDKFRWLTILPDGLIPHEINRIDTLRFDQAMAYDPDIHTRNMHDDITAYNFTREAFLNDHWNKHTSSARGLFIRQHDHQIVGRGFPKFFEVGATKHAKLNNLEFPVTVMRKHDGYLCLVCYDTKLNKLHIYSKSGETNFVKIAEHDLRETGYLTKIKTYFANDALRDTTLLFEIVDPKHDWHIIKYHNLHVYPLAIISNNQRGVWLNVVPDEQHRKIKTFVDWCTHEIDSASWIDTIDQIDNTAPAKRDALVQLKHVLKADEDNNQFREGVVLYGQNMMLKVKYTFYHKAKEFKQALLNYQIYGDLKEQWFYGAASWAEFGVLMGLGNLAADTLTKKFPDLALEINEFDKQNNLKKLMNLYRIGQINKNEIAAKWHEFDQNW